MATKKNQTKTPEPEVIFGDEPLKFLNWSGPVVDLLEADGWRYVQWNNDREGLWEFPLKHWAGTTVVEKFGPVEDIEHGLDEVVIEPGVLTSGIHIAIIADREVWERKIDGKRVFSTTYQKGMSKRYHVLAIVKESDIMEPVILTVRGYTGDYLRQAIRAYKQTILTSAITLAGGRPLPTYMFWANLQAGDVQRVGSSKKSRIHPPSLVIPETQDFAGLLDDLYVGDDLMAMIDGLVLTEYTTWSEAWQPQNLLEATNGTDEDIKLVANILDGGELEPVDLSGYDKGDWMRFAVSTRLYEDTTEAQNAYAKMMRNAKVRVNCKTDADRWFAWFDLLNQQSMERTNRDEVLAMTT